MKSKESIVAWSSTETEDLVCVQYNKTRPGESGKKWCLLRETRYNANDVQTQGLNTLSKYQEKPKINFWGNKKYIYMCVCVRIYIYIYICSLFKYIYIFLYIYVCIYIHIYLCVYIYIFVYIYICSFVHCSFVHCFQFLTQSSKSLEFLKCYKW